MSSVSTYAIYQIVSVSLAKNIVAKLSEIVGREDLENFVCPKMAFNFEIVNEQN